MPVTGQPEISRDNLQPMIAVTARIEGRGIGAAVGDVQKVLGQPNMLGAGVRYELGGLYQQQQIAFAGLARVFAAALVAEFILLLFLYEQAVAAGHHHRLFAAVHDRCLHRALDHRGRSEHHRADGHDDDHRHRHRDGDLLRLGIRRTGA